MFALSQGLDEDMFPVVLDPYISSSISQTYPSLRLGLCVSP